MEEVLAFLAGQTEAALYAALFLILTLCGLGLPVPEDIPLLLSGFLSHMGNMRLHLAIGVAMVAVLLGDTFIFLIGRRWGLSLLQHRFVRPILPEERLEKVRRYFNRYGDFTIFFARFIVGLRAATFWAAGTLKVPYYKFLLFDGLAALLSVPFFVLLGWYFGDEIEMALHWLDRIEKVILVVAVVAIASFVLWEIRRHRGKRDAE